MQCIPFWVVLNKNNGRCILPNQCNSVLGRKKLFPTEYIHIFGYNTMIYYFFFSHQRFTKYAWSEETKQIIEKSPRNLAMRSVRQMWRTDKKYVRMWGGRGMSEWRDDFKSFFASETLPKMMEDLYFFIFGLVSGVFTHTLFWDAIARFGDLTVPANLIQLFLKSFQFNVITSLLWVVKDR